MSSSDYTGEAYIVNTRLQDAEGAFNSTEVFYVKAGDPPGKALRMADKERRNRFFDQGLKNTSMFHARRMSFDDINAALAAAKQEEMAGVPF